MDGEAPRRCRGSEAQAGQDRGCQAAMELVPEPGEPRLSRGFFPFKIASLRRRVCPSPLTPALSMFTLTVHHGPPSYVHVLPGESRAHIPSPSRRRRRSQKHDARRVLYAFGCRLRVSGTPSGSLTCPSTLPCLASAPLLYFPFLFSPHLLFSPARLAPPASPPQAPS